MLRPCLHNAPLAEIRPFQNARVDSTDADGRQLHTMARELQGPFLFDAASWLELFWSAPAVHSSCLETEKANPVFISGADDQVHRKF